LSADGHPLGITDTRQSEGKRKTARRYLVPQSVKRASGVAANLLCDTAEYALGADARGKAQRVLEQHAAFRRRLEELPSAALADAGVQAVRAFYAGNGDFYAGNGAAALANDPCWPEIVAGNPLVTFRLHPQTELVCQRSAVIAQRSAVIAGLADESTPAVAGQRVCLITGQPATAARLHTAIKGVWGAQTSGANIVSFNLEAFTSYNKEQGNNAPVGQAAAFAYTTALNHLLDRNSRQRLQLGDASTVFWAQQEDREAEDAFAAIFGQDDPDARSGLIRSLLAAVRSGQFDGGRGDNRFHVLGLAPNAARLSVRFWHAAPLHEIARQIRQWFDDLAIARSADDPEYPSLFRLLTACAVLGKAENIPPRLGGEIMRSIFAGERFPASWLNAAVMRSRAEQRVNYHRAAAIKACLNRQLRFTSSSFPAKELLPVLDLDNDNPAYRLGRLFATLEKIQEEASPGLNATIRERYYGAASSTPVSVFTTLLRLKNHHLAKIEQRGRAVQFERLLGEILGGVAEFPKHRIPETPQPARTGALCAGLLPSAPGIFQQEQTIE